MGYRIKKRVNNLGSFWKTNPFLGCFKAFGVKAWPTGRVRGAETERSQAGHPCHYGCGNENAKPQAGRLFNTETSELEKRRLRAGDF